MNGRGELAIGFALLVASSVVVAPWGEGRAVAQANSPLRGPSAQVAGSRSLPEPVASYTLHANVDVERHTIAGEGTIAFRNSSSQPISELWVHLYLNAFESNQTVFQRSEGAGFRGRLRGSPGSIEVTRFYARELGVDLWNPHTTSEGEPHDKTDIRVPLPVDVNPGESLNIEIEFVAKLPEIQLRTGYFDSFHFAGQWFPKLAKLEPSGQFAHFPFSRFSEFYSDFGDYDITVEVPPHFLVAASGEEVSQTNLGSSVAHRFVRQGVGDFAFGVWDKFARIERESPGGVRVACFFAADKVQIAELELEAAIRGLELFSEWYGDYPYSSLTIVIPPEGAQEAGGMEYPSLITTGVGGWFSASQRAHQFITLHELAHQWFYGIIASNENAMPFLDEAFASYATSEAAVALYGQPSTIFEIPISIEAYERARSSKVYQRGRVGDPASAFLFGDDYGKLVYARGATILRTVDRVFDRATARALHHYARRHRFSHPTFADWLASLEEAGGPQAAQFVERAVLGREFLDHRVERLVGEPPSQGVLVRRVGGLRLPTEVELVGADGSIERQPFPAEQDAQVFRLSGGAAVVVATVDPDLLIVIDEDLSNNRLSSSVPSALGIFAQGAVLAQIAASLVRP